MNENANEKDLFPEADPSLQHPEAENVQIPQSESSDTAEKEPVISNRFLAGIEHIQSTVPETEETATASVSGLSFEAAVEHTPDAAFNPVPEQQPSPAAVSQASEPAPQSAGVRLYAYNPDRDLPKKKERAYVTRGALVATVCIVLVIALLISGAAFFLGTLYKSGHDLPANGFPLETGTDSETRAPAEETDNNETKAPEVTAPVDENFTLPTESTGEHYTTVKEIAQKTMNSVVEIRTEAVVSGNFMQEYISEGAGSGVIITEDGYIVTNNHVIDGASKITVRLRNGDEFDAVLVGTDSRTDVAVVKIDASGLSVASLGDSDALVEGDIAVVIGNPLGQLGGTVTNGIISALSRTITVEGQQMTLLQTNAAVNPGNSGGGLFNDAAQLVGIVNAKSTGEDIEGIGFAIPINTAKPIIEDLIRYGYVRGRVQLGISTVEILDNWTAMQYRVDRLGVYVYSVFENSDAQKAGLRVGDCFVSVNGTTIASSSQVSSIIQNCSVGDTLSIEVYRNNETVHISVTLTEYKPTPSFN